MKFSMQLCLSSLPCRQLLPQVQQHIIDKRGMKFIKQPSVGRLGGGNRAEGKGVDMGDWEYGVRRDN